MRYRILVNKEPLRGPDGKVLEFQTDSLSRDPDAVTMARKDHPGATVIVEIMDRFPPVAVCPACKGSGFTGYGSGYGDVCDDCAGSGLVYT